VSGTATLQPEFLEFIPDRLKQGTLYVSMKYATATHLCCCGCGMKVVTPLSPTDWKLSFDGEAVTLYPSIGNGGCECESHYWIKENRVVWARRWTRAEVEAGRSEDRRAKGAYYEESSERAVDVSGKANRMVEWVKSWIKRR
jgi:hypothetical protein